VRGSSPVVRSGPSLFPEDFLWGAATSSYQIEGSPLADGAGASIWHHYAHTPGRVANGDSGDIACDHYRRYAHDIALMARLGLNAYRFSIAWARVLPQGTGRLNARGLDFYQRLVDGLLAHGIQPMVTLYHWDLPQALYERGGWLHPDSAEWFADYARAVFEALDDRVPLWLTLNEPWVVTVAGYLQGVHAPGHRSPVETPRVAHALLRAHAAAATAYRAVGRHRIGLTVNLEPQHPASDTAADLAAARRRDAFLNRWFLDPLFLGTYPEELAESFGAHWPPFSAADLHGLRDTVDFLGVNYYSRSVVRDDAAGRPAGAVPVGQDGQAHTAMGWEIYPAGLAEILLWLKGRYANPAVYITENGAAFDDPCPNHGEVPDPQRVDYLRRHLRAARQALAQGVDLRGYFAWSLLDNFEWAHGYAKRFGLVHVDFATQLRTPKTSARFYSEVIRTRGANLTTGE
jgi:beta-glucosidase